MTDRYDGNGPPVWHDHFWPNVLDFDPDNSTFRFDALEFSDGRFCVWSAETSRVISYHSDRDEAKREAQTMADTAYAEFVRDF